MVLLFPVAAAALDTATEGTVRTDILLAEFMAAGPTANEEFVELYNDSNRAINLSDAAGTWKLQYFSSSKDPSIDTPSFTVTLDGTFYPKRRYLIAHSGYLSDTANATFTSNIANTSGYIRIAEFGSDGLLRQADLVGWGSAPKTEGQPLTTLSSGRSYKRKVNEDGRFIDTNNSLSDFFASDCISPESSNFSDNTVSSNNNSPSCLSSWSIASPTNSDNSPTQPPDSASETGTASGNDNQAANELPEQNTGLVAPEISELFPNPASPKTDDKDEYIELYNPNDQPFDLTGYQLEAGMTYSRGYTFTSGNMDAKSYTIFPITDTKLQLSNTESQVRLLDKDKIIVNETASYADAPEGSAWSLINDKWQWTTTPTPGQANQLTEPIIITKTSSKQAKTSKAASTPKKAAASKTNANSTSQETPSDSEELNDQSPIHPLVLAGVGLSAVGYALYEYRKDFGNRLFQFRRYLRSRRASRASLPG